MYEASEDIDTLEIEIENKNRELISYLLLAELC